MNLLVTGGAGFIGSHFVLRHVAKFPRDRVVVLDKLTYAGNQKLLDPVRTLIEFVQGDIADRTLVDSLIKKHGIDTVVNFAAETHVDNSIADSEPFIATNILGTQALIQVLRKHPAVRLLHISTDEVHGDVDDNDPPCGVAHPLIPSSPYAASKAAAEMLLIAAMRTYGLKCCISRCTNNYGPHQFREKFIPTVIRSALADKPVPVYAQGKNRRDWLFVTDHTDALELILSIPWAFDDPGLTQFPSSQNLPTGGAGGHIFQISADSEQQNIDVAKTVLTLLGKPESLIEFVKDRPGHDWRYALDSSAIRKLGWKPAVSFEEGLKMTVEWYRG